MNHYPSGVIAAFLLVASAAFAQPSPTPNAPPSSNPPPNSSSPSTSHPGPTSNTPPGSKDTSAGANEQTSSKRACKSSDNSNVNCRLKKKSDVSPPKE